MDFRPDTDTHDPASQSPSRQTFRAEISGIKKNKHGTGIGGEKLLILTCSGHLNVLISIKASWKRYVDNTTNDMPILTSREANKRTVYLFMNDQGRLGIVFS